MNSATPQSSAVLGMIRRALNLVDARLVDHGVRVATVFDAMLEADGSFNEEDRRDAFMLALFHDIGAYRTEEIDRMVDFETDSVWEHSAYGYLFLRELSPLARLSEIVLYHHMPYGGFGGVDPEIARLAQFLLVADRVDVFGIKYPDREKQDLLSWLDEAKGDLLAPDAVEMFLKAESKVELVGRTIDEEETVRCFASHNVPASYASSLLDMLVHVIDFRSRHTVVHTMTTAQIALSIALRLGMREDEVDIVYEGALVHDLGKIGIPLEILEKPGKLTAEETVVMREHVDLTEQIVDGCLDPAVVRTALRHHEKLDGSGYPRGLLASELSDSERIVAVADIVSALAGTRSYKEAYGKDRVVAIVRELMDAGRIDQRASEALIGDYDTIMEEVARVCAPIMVAYERIQEEYGTLIARLAESGRR